MHQLQAAPCEHERKTHIGQQQSHRFHSVGIERPSLNQLLDSSAIHDYTHAIAQTITGYTMRLTDIKPPTNLRLSPIVKQVLKEEADHEQHSMVNMLEVLLGDYGDSKDIVPTDPKSPSPAHKQARMDRRWLVVAAA